MELILSEIAQCSGDIEHEAMETYKSAVSILTWMRNQHWMRWLERSKD